MRVDSNGKVERFEAIKSLVSGEISYNDDGNGNSKIVYHNDQKPVSDVEIDAELKKLQAEYDAQEYARKREAEYPSIQECVHAILDDDLTSIQEKRQAVKTKYPKS